VISEGVAQIKGAEEQCRGRQSPCPHPRPRPRGLCLGFGTIIAKNKQSRSLGCHGGGCFGEKFQILITKIKLAVFFATTQILALGQRGGDG
jgi:hypothetical protein